MGNRTELSELLNSLIEPYKVEGKRQVFFQSPASYMLVYPTIIYSLNRVSKLDADNDTYRLHHFYSIQLITKDPDDPLIDQIASLPKCSFDRDFVADNLYHYNYTIYY